MNVKFYFLTLLAAIAMVSCVDESYDLAQVQTDDIVIGDDESVFTVPIATITITKSDFDDFLASSGAKEFDVVSRASSSSNLSFTEIIDLVNAFLPTGEEVDIDKLTGDSTSDDYTEYLTELLVTELQEDESKQADLAQVLVDNYETLSDDATTDIFNTLGVDLADDSVFDADNNLSFDVVSEALTAALEDEATVEELKSSINTAVSDNVIDELKDNQVTAIDLDIDSFDLPTDVIDILTGNGRIEIIATYEHDFPFSFDLADLKLTGLSSGSSLEFPVTAALTEDEDPTEIDLDELADILSEGSHIESLITLKTFTSTGDTGSALKIKLVVKKYGGIAL